jgi:hypothetical protein
MRYRFFAFTVGALLTLGACSQPRGARQEPVPKKAPEAQVTTSATLDEAPVYYYEAPTIYITGTREGAPKLGVSKACPKGSGPVGTGAGC